MSTILYHPAHPVARRRRLVARLQDRAAAGVSELTYYLDLLTYYLDLLAWYIRGGALRVRQLLRWGVALLWGTIKDPRPRHVRAWWRMMWLIAPWQPIWRTVAIGRALATSLGLPFDDAAAS